MFKIGEIRELIRLLDETSVAELHVESESMKLHLKKSDGIGTQTVVQAVAPAPQAPAVIPQATQSVQATAPAASSPVQQAPEADETNIHTILSPMVGTFYRSPSPDAGPFVEVGSKVGEKTVVCIVEAMKLMNEIEAEATGEIVAVFVENGQLVEYGQPLFKVKLS